MLPILLRLCNIFCVFDLFLVPTSNLDDFIDAFDEGNGSGYTTLYSGDVPITII